MIRHLEAVLINVNQQMAYKLAPIASTTRLFQLSPQNMERHSAQSTCLVFFSANSEAGPYVMCIGALCVAYNTSVAYKPSVSPFLSMKIVEATG